jgi:hypothetical protein
MNEGRGIVNIKMGINKANVKNYFSPMTHIKKNLDLGSSSG